MILSPPQQCVAATCYAAFRGFGWLRVATRSLLAMALSATSMTVVNYDSSTSAKNSGAYYLSGSYETTAQ